MIRTVILSTVVSHEVVLEGDDTIKSVLERISELELAPVSTVRSAGWRVNIR